MKDNDNIDDDFGLVELGLITLGNRYDVYDLYRMKDCVYGKYLKKKWHLIVGAANNETQLSRNLSEIAIYSEKGLHHSPGISERVFNSNFYLN